MAILRRPGSAFHQHALELDRYVLAKSVEIGKLAGEYRRLVELRDREGWKALGYNSLEDCLTEKLAVGRSQALRKLQAADVKRGMLKAAGNETESEISDLVLHAKEDHLITLSKLDKPQHQLKVLKKAHEVVKDIGGRVTSALLKKIINSLLGIEAASKNASVWQALQKLHVIEKKYLLDYPELEPVFEAMDLVEAELKKRDEKAAKKRKRN